MATAQTLRELAIKAANTAELNSFSLAYKPDHAQTERISQSFSKYYPPLSRNMNVCDSGLVKQLCFVKPNFKLAVLSCPFPASNNANEGVVAGSLGDGFNICPVTIRIRDVTGHGISVATSSTLVNDLQMPTSKSNPLEEDGPPQLDEGIDPEPAGPDRVKIIINNPDEVPCFVAVPKVFPFPIGHSLPTELTTNEISETAPPTPPGNHLQEFNLWFETMKYGVQHLNNNSIHSKDTLFVYESIDKTDFKADRLVSQFTTTVTYLTQDEALYHQVHRYATSEKEKAASVFGGHTNLPASSTPSVISTGDDRDSISAATNPRPEGDLKSIFKDLSQALIESSTKSSQSSAERERVAEAKDSSAFYQILFASVTECLQEDGSTKKVLSKATLNPLFESGVLQAVKNSKATRAFQSILETTAAEMTVSSDRFAASSHLVPKMFDQPVTAALRASMWEHRHTVLHPEGIKTHFGLHHLAPPRTWTAAYKSRLEGAIKLIQQEQVEEDKSKFATKTTEIYHMGRMGTLAELNETIGNFFALMHCLVEVNPDYPPLIWTEMEKFDKILRTDIGRDWADLHRNLKEVLFNVLQDIQSTIAGFVTEARKQGYKNAVSAGKNISPKVFDMACHQGQEFRRNLQTAVGMMTAGHYKEVPITYSLFQPPQNREISNPRKRDLQADPSTPSQPTRLRNSSNTTFNTDRPTIISAGGTGRQTHRNPTSQFSGTTATPANAPICTTITSATGAQPLPGHTVFKLHSDHADMRRLPNPGPIFPHPTRSGQYAMMCNRSAYEDRVCPSTDCPHYHFPLRLSTLPADIKNKLKTWVANQPHVSWSTLVSSWANSAGTAPGN